MECDGMGLEGWGSCTLASFCEYWDDSCLSPKTRVASLPTFCYLFILGFIPLLNFLHLKVSGF